MRQSPGLAGRALGPQFPSPDVIAPDQRERFYSPDELKHVFGKRAARHFEALDPLGKQMAFLAIDIATAYLGYVPNVKHAFFTPTQYRRKFRNVPLGGALLYMDVSSGDLSVFVERPDAFEALSVYAVQQGVVIGAASEDGGVLVFYTEATSSSVADCNCGCASCKKRI